MRTARDTTARGAVAALLQPHLPRGWQLLEHEGTVDDGDVVRVRIAVREFAHSDTGTAAAHLVTVRVTVTVPTGDSLAAAEPKLDDAMDLFLFALDDAGIDWDSCTKGRFEDENNRLGYQFDIQTRTTPTKEN